MVLDEGIETSLGQVSISSMHLAKAWSSARWR